MSSTRPTYSTVPCPRSRAQRRVRPSHQLVDHAHSRSVAVPRRLRGRLEDRARRLNGSTRVRDEFVPVLRRLGRRVRALIVTNLYPTAGAARVRPLRAGPGRRAAPPRRRRDRAVLVPARPARVPRRRAGPAEPLPARGRRFDVVHAHFGLDRVAGAARRARAGGRHAARQRPLPPALEPITRAALPFTALPATVSREFSENLPGAGATRRVAVLPVGIDLERFRPIPRREARERLGLDPDGPYLLFPHDPARPLKRHDRAVEAAGDVPLLTWAASRPTRCPTGSTPPTPCSSPHRRKGSGCR